MEESSEKKCCYCHKQSAHPAYNDWCEDCYADIKLTKMYGRRKKDRSLKSSPATIKGVDIFPSVDPLLGK
jgi:hypothetical protein|tara:strand:+ start:210 stop:419 length:210 start_codon:yes stop_codon:yes gene_type:complete